MNKPIEHSGLQIAPVIYTLVSDEICPAVGIDADHFWRGFADIVYRFAPRNIALLDKREKLQEQIDHWHQSNAFDYDSYKAFLQEIGYLIPEGPELTISPQHVDSEIAVQAGPQLVVPIMNARFALNAVNARWGSLYDALYGNDVIGEDGGAEREGAYNPVRGQRVIDYGRDFLDQAVPLAEGSHHQANAYRLENGALQVLLTDATVTALRHPQQLVGYLGSPDSPDSV